ncbi:hypothetical protein [Micromonospora sp. NPDC023956]|uniref:hypothetical protein n=1 Tax=Micromonospora sp. NPDC023956 TaxID=3155722 RepID=UPI00340E163B
MKETFIAVGVLAAWALTYALSCWIRPFRDCWVCDGKAHHRSAANRKLSRPCRWCKATGKRLRIGRRVWNRFARIRNAAL